MKSRLYFLAAAAALLPLPPLSLFAENEIGYIEKFALSPDRAKALAELAPGTPEYFYYHALHYQHTRQTDKLKDVLAQWKQKFPNQSGARDIIQNREILLSHEANPDRTYEFLRHKLNIQFDHQQEVQDQKPNLPTSLSQDLIGRNIFLAWAITNDQLQGLTVQEMERLISDKVPLKDEQARLILGKLNNPDVPGLVELIARDLKLINAPAFGSHPIHNLLLPAQLDKLEKLAPSLVVQEAFIKQRLRRLAPAEGEDIDFDPAARKVWLERVWTYVSMLPPAYNSLKAHVLYQRLDLDRRMSVYNRELFLEYLKLPRDVGYVPAELRRGLRSQGAHWVDFQARFPQEELSFPPIGNDESLVKDYFMQIFAQDAAQGTAPEAAMAPYAQWVNVSWLRPILAEAMITLTGKEPSEWSSYLSAAEFQRLKERVDIEFTGDNKQFHQLDEDITVDLNLKNVPNLIVRIYEVNALGYFLQHQKQLNTDVNLDGLVANSELKKAYQRTPFERKREKFTFPELKGKRGAWIIEFIGSGRSNRALVRVGQWSLIQQSGPVGAMVAVMNEKHEHVKDAVLWMDGRRWEPNAKTGLIHVPYTTQPGAKQVVIASADGNFASLGEMYHQAEQYSLHARFYLNREQLLSGKDATVTIRPSLLAGGSAQPLALVENVQLRITTTTLDGVSTTKEIKDLKLNSDKDYAYTFAVPDRLAQIHTILTGDVEQMSKGNEKIQLQSEERWAINTAEKSAITRAGRFTRFPEGYVYELLGKNGEPVSGHAVHFNINHEGYSQPVQVSLSTDDKGRVQLGALEGIQYISASSYLATPASLIIPRDHSQWPEIIHAVAGASIRLPLVHDMKPQDFTLLELRALTPVSSHPDKISGAAKELVIEGLTAGEYVLHSRRESRNIRLRVMEGQQTFGWLFGKMHHLQLSNTRPLNISDIAVEGDNVVIKLSHANAQTRVHVAASRFMPDRTLYASLGQIPQFSPSSIQPAVLPNLYASGREISDEYQYILDRRYAKSYPGNMLTRPGLLLNPWELRSTDQTSLNQRGGEAAGATSGGRPGATNAPASPAIDSLERERRQIAEQAEPSLDFLATKAPLLLNLTADAEGVVRVPKAQLGDRHYVEVYAEDLSTAVQRNLVLPDASTKYEDVRLARTLPPEKPYTEKRQATVLRAGDKLTVQDVRTAEMESYETVGSVYSLYMTLSGNNTELGKFGWILQWPKLKPEEKRVKYSEFACHELNLFLSRKDPGFFQEVIKPYLANKKEKTFMDEYLLESDLQHYLSVWRYSKLNAAEKALLGRRLSTERASTARHLRDLWELLPPNEEQLTVLFDTALRGRSMDLGFEMKLGYNNDHDFDGTKDSSNMSAGQSLRRKTDRLAGKKLAESAPRGLSLSVSEPAADPFGATPAQPADALKPAEKAKQQDGQLGTQALGDAPQNNFESRAYFRASREELESLRDEARAYYRRLGPVKEWAENQYWKTPLNQLGPELILVNAFWRDLAEWDGQGAFLSPNLAEAHHSFAEIMLALAVLDLPFEAPEHKTEGEGPELILTAGGPTVIYHKALLPAEAAAPDKAPSLLVSQAFFRQDDRYRTEGNVKFDKYLSTEFLTGVVYGANIVVTNPTSTPTKLDLLLQIPQGSLPALGSRPTRSEQVQLEPYTTKTYEYYFYFPSIPAEGGKFVHYPVNASIQGQAAAAATPFTFNVVAKPTEFDKASWEYISQYASEEETLTFLEQQNLDRLNLVRIAWRCRTSVEFYKKLITLLNKRHRYDNAIYSYGLHHKDTPTVQEFLKAQHFVAAELGPYLQSSLVQLDPIVFRSYEHLEYSPLVNQRVHRIGAEHRISTPEQLEQYHRLLNIIAHKAAPDAMDNLGVVYHLFLQDRVDEALARLRTIPAEGISTKLQYDYLTCYADFYEGDLAGAKGIASQYANHPVTRWKNLFNDVLGQISEIEGNAAPLQDKPDREKAQGALAAGEPSYEFKVEDKKIVLNWRNLREVRINYYLMDPEFAFSSNPFTSQGAERFTILKPNKTAQVVLPEGKDTLMEALPQEYSQASVLVEVIGAGQRKTHAYHANSLKLSLAENYGRLEVRERTTDKALPKTYVKVYARLSNGTVRFLKDGYTDLRGRFDYSSVNSPETARPLPAGQEVAAEGQYQTLRPGELDSVERLAILISSDAHGTEVREVEPPAE